MKKQCMKKVFVFLKKKERERRGEERRGERRTRKKRKKFKRNREGKKWKTKGII